MDHVQRTERGWAGHFICADRCKFRRNTLLEYKDVKIVVSTIGLMVVNGEFKEIGHNRYFETMAFHVDAEDLRWFDADVSREINFQSDWSINEIDADDKANEMHENVVDELTMKLIKGYKFEN